MTLLCLILTVAIIFCNTECGLRSSEGGQARFLCGAWAPKIVECGFHRVRQRLPQSQRGQKRKGAGSQGWAGAVWDQRCQPRRVKCNKPRHCQRLKDHVSALLIVSIRLLSASEVASASLAFNVASASADSAVLASCTPATTLWSVSRLSRHRCQAV